MEAAGVLAVTFGLGYVLSAALSGLPSTLKTDSSSAPSLRLALTSARRSALLLFHLTLLSTLTLTFASTLFLLDSTCSVLTKFQSFFDQLSRVLIFSLAIWTTRRPSHSASARQTSKSLLITLIVVRAAIGVVALSLSGWAFRPLCVLEQARVNEVPGRATGITQVVWDMCTLFLGAVSAISHWRAGVARGIAGGDAAGAVAVLVTLNLWNLASIPQILSIGTVFQRSTPPLAVLALLLFLLRCYPQAFWYKRDGEEGERMVAGSDGGDSAPMVPAPAAPGFAYNYNPTPDVEAMKPSAFGLGLTESQRSNSIIFRSLPGKPLAHPGTMVAWSEMPTPAVQQHLIVDPSQDAERVRIDAQYEREEAARREALAKAVGGPTMPPPSVVTVTTTPRTIASFAGLPTPDLRRAAPPHVVRRDSELGDRMYRMSAATFSTEEDSTRYTASHAGFVLGPPPPAARVMLVKGIEYDDPALVESVMTRATGRYTRQSARRRSPPAKKMVFEKAEEVKIVGPIMERKRSIRRDTQRGLFPRSAIMAPAAPPPTQPLPEPPVMNEKLEIVLSEEMEEIVLTPDFPLPPPGTEARPNSAWNLVVPEVGKRGSAVSDDTDGDAYETAKAWVASVAPVQQRAVAVDVRKGSTEDSSTVRKGSEASVESVSTVMLSIDSSIPSPNRNLNGRSVIRKSGLIYLASPVAEESGSDIYSDSYSSSASSDDRDPGSLSLGEDSSSIDSRQSLDRPHFPANDEDDEVVISDLDDALEIERIHIAQRKVNARMSELERFSTKTLDRAFNIGDAIPTFYSVRKDGGYGNRRKRPPIPLGRVPVINRFMRPYELETKNKEEVKAPELMQTRSTRSSLISPSTNVQDMKEMREETKTLQARLTMIMGKSKASGQWDDLLRRLPSMKQAARVSVASDDGANLLAQIECEMSQQENEWKGMRKHASIGSSISSLASTPIDIAARRQSKRESMLATVNKGIGRRLSMTNAARPEVVSVASNTSAETAETDTSVESAGDWQTQVAAAQYRSSVPSFVEAPMFLLKTDGTEMEYDSDEESDEESEVELLQPYAVTSALSAAFPPASPAESIEIVLCPSLTRPQLWASAPALSTALETPGLLWRGNKGAVPASEPAALAVRPKRRYDSQPNVLTSMHLWIKRSPAKQPCPGAQLWSSPRCFRTRSIMKPRVRVTEKKTVRFSEEVVLVDIKATGAISRLKNFWGLKTAAAAAPATEVVAMPRLKRVSAISHSLPAYTPVEVELPPPAPFAGRLWTKGSAVERASFTALWPASEPLEVANTAREVMGRIDATPVVRFKASDQLWAREAVLSTTVESAGLWSAPTRVVFAGKLWTKAAAPVDATSTTTLLWPSAPAQVALPTADAIHSRLDDAPLPTFDAFMTLWRPETVVDKPAPAGLWMTALTSGAVDRVAGRGNDVPAPALWRKEKVDMGKKCGSGLWGVGPSPDFVKVDEEVFGSSPRRSTRADTLAVVAEVSGGLWVSAGKGSNCVPTIVNSTTTTTTQIALWAPPPRPPTTIAGNAQVGNRVSTKLSLSCIHHQSRLGAHDRMWGAPRLPRDHKQAASPAPLWTPTPSHPSTKSITASMAAVNFPGPQHRLWSEASFIATDRFDPSFSFEPKARPAKKFSRDPPPPATGSMWQRNNSSPSSSSSSSSKQQQPRTTPKPTRARLWTKPSSAKKQGLWTHDGSSDTLADIATARNELSKLWNKNDISTPLFAGLPVDTKRTKREHSTKSLPAVSEGLWKQHVAEQLSKAPSAADDSQKLWTAFHPTPMPASSPAPTSLWSADSASTPSIFAHLPVDTARATKPHPLDTLPIFSESLWKATHALPAVPALWTRTPKSTGLWPATPVLSQIPVRKTQKHLWSANTARRTTALKPSRARTTFRPSTAEQAPVTGKLWAAPKQQQPQGMWRRRVRSKTVASDTIPPKVPLWSKNTAARTTTLKPSRSDTAKKTTQSTTLPKATGILWAKSTEVVQAPLWNPAPTRRASLWAPIDPVPSRSHTPVFVQDPLPAPPTSLWIPASTQPTALWQPTHDSVSPTSEPVTAPLWSAATARRQTELLPTRAAPTPKKSDKTVEKATGTMWHVEPAPGLSRRSTIDSVASFEEEEEEEDEVVVTIAGHQKVGSVDSLWGGSGVWKKD